MPPTRSATALSLAYVITRIACAIAQSGLLTSCMNDCSLHGVCVRSQCECDLGWSGPDCSYPVMAFLNRKHHIIMSARVGQVLQLQRVRRHC